MAEQSNPVWHQDELSDEDNPSWAVEAADTRIRIVWYLKKGGYWRLFLNNRALCDLLDFKKDEVKQAQERATEVVIEHLTELIGAVGRITV